MKIKYTGPKEVFHGFGQSWEKDEVKDIKDANMADDILAHAYFEEDKGKTRAKADKDKLAESLKEEREAEIEDAEVVFEEAKADLEEAKRK